MAAFPEFSDPADLHWRGAIDLALGPLHRALAHDLRAPLNAVGLNLTLVRRTLEGDTAAARRWLTVVEEESRRLEQLLTEHLALLTWNLKVQERIFPN